MTGTKIRLSPAQVAHRIADIVIDKKGTELLVMDIADCSDIADYMIMASGGNKRQVQAISQEIRKQLKEAGHLPLSVTGLEHGWWVLVDYGDVLVHVMQDDARRFYDIEALWADGQVVRRSPDVGQLAG